jgi:2,3-bisphosphoglycerate-dependent phosphoglycerate mutase
LNERHYGDLQGKNKTEIRDEYGDEQFTIWRRSYDTPPPEISANSEYSQVNDTRYADVNPPVKTEALKNVLERALPFLKSEVFADLKAGKTVLLTAHGNSIRAIVKYLDGISDDEIAGVNIPTGIPLLYELDDDFKVIDKRYLDPVAAEESIKAVANQGKK